MNTRLRFRGFSSFGARVFWSVVPIVCLFLVFQGMDEYPGASAPRHGGV